MRHAAVISSTTELSRPVIIKTCDARNARRQDRRFIERASAIEDDRRVSAANQIQGGLVTIKADDRRTPVQN
jgi:hypothetical protein